MRRNSGYRRRGGPDVGAEASDCDMSDLLSSLDTRHPVGSLGKVSAVSPQDEMAVRSVESDGHAGRGDRTATVSAMPRPASSARRMPRPHVRMYAAALLDDD